LAALMNTTVYVIDDDEGVRNGLKALLESEGQPVEVFDKAEDFLDNYQPEKQGCLLLDLNMPGMNGHDVLSELSKRKLSIPVIVITSTAGKRTKDRVLREGAVGLLKKPIQYNQLISSLTNANNNRAKSRSSE